jgi:deazaflavin-dependent oxidoreductase (nitroreductase family)
VPATPQVFGSEVFCYLTTKGRVTGRPHEIEMWFGLGPGGRTLYMLSGGGDRSDWVRNLKKDPGVTARLGGERFEGRARVVEDPEEDGLARRLLVEKYERKPGSLSNWRRRARPVAIDLSVR